MLTTYSVFSILDLEFDFMKMFLNKLIRIHLVKKLVQILSSIIAIIILALFAEQNNYELPNTGYGERPKPNLWIYLIAIIPYKLTGYLLPKSNEEKQKEETKKLIDKIERRNNR